MSNAQSPKTKRTMFDVPEVKVALPNCREGYEGLFIVGACPRCGGTTEGGHKAQSDLRGGYFECDFRFVPFALGKVEATVLPGEDGPVVAPSVESIKRMGGWYDNGQWVVYDPAKPGEDRSEYVQVTAQESMDAIQEAMNFDRPNDPVAAGEYLEAMNNVGEAQTSFDAEDRIGIPEELRGVALKGVVYECECGYATPHRSLAVKHMETCDGAPVSTESKPSQEVTRDSIMATMETRVNVEGGFTITAPESPKIKWFRRITGLAAEKYPDNAIRLQPAHNQTQDYYHFSIRPSKLLPVTDNLAANDWKLVVEGTLDGIVEHLEERRTP